MIASFRDKETEKLWLSGKSMRLPADLQLRAFKKLAILNAAITLLETLRGNRAGQHSIRVNDQYRVCFVWRDGNAFEVEIVDYHYQRSHYGQIEKSVCGSSGRNAQDRIYGTPGRKRLCLGQGPQFYGHL